MKNGCSLAPLFPLLLCELATALRQNDQNVPVYITLLDHRAEVEVEASTANAGQGMTSQSRKFRYWNTAGKTAIQDYEQGSRLFWQILCLRKPVLNFLDVYS